MVLGKRDEAVYNEYVAKFEGYTHEQFDTQIDAALQSIIADISSVSASQRSEEISIRGMTKPRSGFLIDYVFTFLGAYKMQLFLQLKHAGLKDLTTYNLWAGIDHK